jgi:hypothetical protein
VRFFTAHSQSPSPNINRETKTNEYENEATGSLQAGYEKLIQNVIRKLKVKRTHG